MHDHFVGRCGEGKIGMTLQFCLPRLKPFDNELLQVPAPWLCEICSNLDPSLTLRNGFAHHGHHYIIVYKIRLLCMANSWWKNIYKLQIIEYLILMVSATWHSGAPAHPRHSGTRMIQLHLVAHTVAHSCTPAPPRDPVSSARMIQQHTSIMRHPLDLTMIPWYLVFVW